MSEIESLALDWYAKWRAAADLKWDRAAERCELESPYEPGSPQVPPCWMGPRDNGSGGLDNYEESEWCEPCRRRQTIHLRYQAAVRERAAALRKLQRVCAKTAPALPAIEVDEQMESAAGKG